MKDKKLSKDKKAFNVNLTKYRQYQIKLRINHIICFLEFNLHNKEEILRYSLVFLDYGTFFKFEW